MECRYDRKGRQVPIVASPDGSELIRGESEGSIAEADALGADLLSRGAAKILEAVYG